MRPQQSTPLKQAPIHRPGSASAFVLWLRAHARLALLLLLVASGILGPLAQNAGTLFPTAAAHGLSPQTAQAKPVPFDPHVGATSVNHQPPQTPQSVRRATDTPAPMSPPRGITMPQGLLPLQPGAATTFQGADGRFEVDVPAGAITTADQAAAGGALQLSIRQVAPASGSSAGGSGLVSFGGYLVQVVDGSGVLVSQGLRKPITIKMRLPKAANALDLTRAFVIFNSSPPVGVSSAPTSANTPDIRSGASVTDTIPGLGAFASQPATYDPAQQTLSTAYTLSSPSALMSFDTNSSVATFGHPDPFNVDLNAGGLTTSIPLDVPSGPGGLTPPVALTYSSAAVSEQHNIQAAAGWIGEGWNLSFGSISWAEHNSNATCTSGCGNGWEDTWQLSDPFGTSVELIPPNINVSTYFDDTANPITASPIRWHAAPENYAKIYSYTSALTLPDGGGVHPPCFRVFLPNGIMEEFGCTADSLEYYTSDSSGTVQDFISSWNLDLITDPQGNQIHITYQQDIAGSVNHYVRDAEPATVEWDSPNCHDAQQMCTGANWAPLMRVQFMSDYTFASGRILQQGNQTCNTGWHLRCDDTLDLSGSGGVGAPLVQSTLALEDALVQVRPTSTGAWNTLKDYQFYYNINGPRTTTDATTGNPISAAGYFLLERLNVVGMNGVSLPTSSFEYSAQNQYYEDSNYHPTPLTNCGPAWNTGTGSGCLLWSQNQPGNSYYLASYENGMGLHEDFYWQLARNNTHGVPSGGQPANPFWCNGYQTRSPCQEADDQNWSRVVLTKTETSVKRAASTGNVQVTSRVINSYVLTPLIAQECGDCTDGMYWGNQNDGDYLDYYNGKFMGFAEADVSNPDGSVVEHHYDSTEGYGVYDASVPCLAFSPPCHAAPWWDVTNAAHGHETETDYYDTDGATLLRQDTASYAVTCPPSGVAGSPSWSTTVNGSPYTYTWDGKLVAELDHGNPVAVCAVQLTQSLTNTFNGAPNYARSWTNYSYDSYGRLTDATANANDGGGAGSPTVIRTHTDYVWNDSVSASGTGATGHYLIDFPVQRYNTDAAGDLRAACMRYQYDGNGYVGGQQSALTLGELTSSNSAVDCGSAGNGWTPSGVMRATAAYDSYGNVIATTDPLGVKGNSAHLGCSLSGVSYTACLTYDSVYQTQVVSQTNTLGQTTQIAYASDASGGYGLWPTSATDPNGAVTTTVYDGLGRPVSETLPAETSGLTTATWAYVVTCGGAGSGPQTPCVRVDETQRVNASATVAGHAFYNGYGQLVESRDQAPGGQDVAQYAVYDTSTREVRASNPYFVSAWDGVTGFGYSPDDVNQLGAVSTYDGLGRTLTSADPLGNVTTSGYSVACSVIGSDSTCYAATSVTDANAHQSQVFSDAFGRATYTRDLSGNGGAIPYTTYRTIAATYDYSGNETTITQPNGSTTSFSYDDAGRQLTMTDPDRGHESYAYDEDGNVIQATDARTESIYAGYDGLNRQLWRNSSDTPNNAYVSYNYDQSGHGSGIGRLTSESFVSPSDPSLTGSYSYTYDARGQLTSSTTVLLGASYPTSMTYDDAGEPLSLIYPDGAVATSSYSQGWLSGASWTQHSVTTPILGAVNYTGAAGAFGAITSANVGQNAGAALYHYAAQLDNDGRLTTDTLSRVSDGATLYDEQLSYDPVGNVSTVSTILPAGTDHQLFCYDAQNRLTWAGTTADNPCNNPAATGSFGGASYTQSFSYDTLNRLTSSPLGSYTYGDASHLHAATSVSSGYTASYDAAGDMLCRAPSSSTTCSGAQTGQHLTWDVEGRLASWRNTTTAPTVTAKYLYDGEGNRVVQQVTDSTAGTTTTTSYIGSLETVTSDGTTTTTTDYATAGKVLAESVNGPSGSTLSYLVTNYQGSVVEALDSTGTVGVTASHLYAPYGGVRYSNGAMPTDYGYTGQRADAATGLDYYGARYYDPMLGQFTSADTLLAGGLNRYGYVGGNPTTATDPTGHMLWVAKDLGGAGAAMAIFALSPAAGGGVRTLPNGIPIPRPSAQPSEPDEMSRARTGGGSPGTNELRRALARNGSGISLSDLPYLNQVRANRYKAAHPLPPPPPPGPKAKTSNEGAGAPPNVPRSPVAGPAHPEDDNGCGCGGPYLYRGLGPHDDPSKGIFPRNPGNHESVFRHVRYGSRPWYPGDQFISLTTNESIAYSFSSRVITVDPSKIVGSIIDLTTPEGRLAAGLKPRTPAWNYAASKFEVLLEDGYIPPEAIVSVDLGDTGC